MVDFNRDIIGHELTYTGAAGNQNSYITNYRARNIPPDSRIFIAKIDPGTLLSAARLIFLPLGVGTFIRLGYTNATETVDDYFYRNLDGSMANAVFPGHFPKVFEEDTYIIVTTSGADITGNITLVYEYIYKGIK